MRNRVRAQEIVAVAKLGTEALRYPHPGCFAKRGWICLIPKGLTFFETTKRLQELDRS